MIRPRWHRNARGLLPCSRHAATPPPRRCSCSQVPPRKPRAGASSPAEAAAPGLLIDVADAPTPEHFAAWTSQRSPGDAPDSAEAFRALIAADQPCEFVTAYAAHPDGSRSMVAACRVVERSKWGVVTNLITRPDLRRRGAGRSVARAAAALLAQRGVRSYLVDIEAGNEASIDLPLRSESPSVIVRGTPSSAEFGQLNLGRAAHTRWRRCRTASGSSLCTRPCSPAGRRW